MQDKQRNSATAAAPTTSLDPSEWEGFRKLMHGAVDEAIDYLSSVRTQPVWRPVPAEVRARLSEPLPQGETPIETVYEDFTENVLPYATGNIHPRFFGWVHGSGQAGGLLAEMLAATMNSNCGGRDHGAIYIERQVLNWCRELFGFPADAGGVLVSGTSMANLIALAVARNQSVEDVRKKGVANARLAAYASREVHESAVKALEVLGLGSESLRRIDVDEQFAIDVEALRKAIADDRAAGLQPFCIVACAGAVGTGATDDLERIANLCATEGIWMHVDGAFGALCMLSETLRPRLKGIERADSLAFDFHKWAHVQYDAGAVLVRRGDLQRAAFSMQPDYLEHSERGLGGGGDWPCDYGIELSRGFRALKIWFALKQHGTRKLARAIEANCVQARYLAERIEREPEIELLSPALLNIVCFRVHPAGMDDEAALDRLNREIVADLQESGIAAPSTTRINGRGAIRVNITNHRTELNDLDMLIDAVLERARARRSQNSEVSR